MSKPFQEGRGWAFRLRKQGQDIYRGGFASAAAARKAMEALSADIDAADKATGLGPHQTSVGVAFMDYARERLPFLKGARQDANRINRYLRHLGLPIIRLTEAAAPTGSVKADMRGEVGKTRYWDVAFVQESKRRIPNSLKQHRTRLQEEAGQSDRLRQKLAATLMADVSAHQLQLLMDALVADKYGAASVHLERAELRRLFKHARSVWKWSRPVGNPTAGLRLPTIDNARNRVLTNEEWQKMAAALSEYANPYVLPIVCIMLESAMRSCEPLTKVCWHHVDWEACILHLDDSKTGKRDVPLSSDAMAVLTFLRDRAGEDVADARIFPTTYEALKKAWSVACKQSNIKGVKLHDLRHTAATRYALEFNGSLPIIKVITGHKTYAMLNRYINIDAKQVARMMHNEELSDELAPAGYKQGVLSVAGAEALRPAALQEPVNVVKVDFVRKSVA